MNNSIKDLDGRINSLNIQSEKKIDLNYKINKPYPYQLKIFEQIKDEENSIIFLETGKGKTLISVMLIGHLLDFDVFDPNKIQPKSKHKKIVFLVCEVALVEQQRLVISNNTSLTVEALSSKKMKKFKGDVKKFRTFWQNCDVFVSTHQIIYNLLSCGFIKIFDIDLLIFDEAHHMDGNHPYNIIMNEFYFFYKYNVDSINLCGKNKLPRILGLTASPLKKKLNNSEIISTAYKALNQLCENMDAKMVIDPEVLGYEESIGQDNIFDLSPEEVKREYIQVKSHKNNPHFLEILKQIHSDLLTPIIDYIFQEEADEEIKILKSDYVKFVKDKFDSDDLTEFNKNLSQYKYLYELRKKSWLFLVFEKIQINLFMIMMNLNGKAVLNFLETYRKFFENLKCTFNQISKVSTTTLEICHYTKYPDFNEKNLISLNKIITNCINDLNRTNSYKNFETDRLVSLIEKIHELFGSDRANQSFDLIVSNINNSQNNSASDHRLLIFVENRIVSETLSGIINEQLDETINFNLNSSHKIKSLSLVGVGKKQTENSFFPKNSSVQINQKIRKFTSGEVKIMVCTSTVEEGLDVKQCDAVMVFTELKTTKSYIQMKGRARKSNSKFCIFTPDKNKTINMISNNVKLIISMRKLFDDGIVKDFRDEDSIIKKYVDFENYFVKSTHAKLTLKNVPQFFNELFQVLNDRYRKGIQKKLIFIEEKSVSINFRAELYIICAWTNETLYFKSRLYSDKASAENYCYLEFLKHCNQKGYIDDNFQLLKKP